MPDRQVQGEDAVTELRGQHDARGDQRPDRRGAAGRAAAGQQHREQERERVGHRGANVRGLHVQPEQAHQQGVLRELGR